MPLSTCYETPQALLAQLVSLPSVNPVYGGSGEQEVAQFVRSWLEERGVACQTQDVAAGRWNVVARIGHQGSGGLLVEAHMDTVGVEGWAEGNPFALAERNGRYYGRGTCDTKASLACFLLLAAHFHQHPEQLSRPLIFAATVDEENEQLGALALAEVCRDLQVEAALTGEPTRSRIVSRHKGVSRYKIHSRGKAAHGSTPELGENAVYAIAPVISEIAALERALAAKPRGDEMERGTVNLGRIAGGHGFNVVPDACELDIDRRIAVSETMDETRAQLDAIVSKSPRLRLETALERPPLRGLSSGPLVEDLLSAAKRAGVATTRIDAPYMTNAVAYEAVGVPSVVFGPGDIAQAHKADEYIESGEIEASLAVLKALLTR